MKKKEEIIDELGFRFKASGNLIKKLGEESIANRNIAVIELIKNSYDAYASNVTISINHTNTNQASLIISDDGHGMNNSDIENKWLNIATDNKLTKVPRNKKERISVGEKGIGRLSSERLGDQTILHTKVKGENFGHKIIFDWSDYQKKNILFDQVVNKGFQIKKNKTEAGTTIEIHKLRDDWNDLTFQKELLKDIYLLHPPYSKPAKFKIITENFIFKSLPKIDKAFLGSSAYRMKVKLISGNLLEYEISSLSNKRKKGKINLTEKLTCGDCEFELLFFYRSESYLIKNIGVSQSFTRVEKNKEVLDEYCGIKIYRDGFRVKPYGEEGQDWTDLELYYQNNSMFPRQLNVFGAVKIGKYTNPRIADTTTREGIILTKEFTDLRRFVQQSIKDIFVPFRSEVEGHKKKARKKRLQNKKVQTIPSIPQTTLPKEKLIKNIGGSYPDNFYEALEQEINDCYNNNYPNATFFLSRKIIENLVFNILEKKYPNEISLWFDISKKMRIKFSQLVANLFSKKPDFKPNAQSYIDKFNSLVAPFRKEANSKAHNIIDYLSDKSELKKFKINDIIQLLIKIYHHM